jgi:hypothetical protein
MNPQRASTGQRRATSANVSPPARRLGFIGTSFDGHGRCGARPRSLAISSWRVGFGAAWVTVTCGVASAATYDTTVAVERSAYEAREQLPGSSFVFNRELGYLSGGALKASVRFGDRAWEASVRALSGDLAYRGFSQFGLPIETRTDLSLARFELAVEVPGALAIGRGEARGALALARQSIDRRIRPSATSGELTELLETSEVGVRARLGMPLLLGGRPAAAALRVEAWRPWRQRLGVDSAGVLDMFQLEPSPRNSLRLEAAIAVSMTDSSALGATVGASWLRFGKSDAAPVSTAGRPAGVAIYPGSRQRLRTIEVHWTWSFDPRSSGGSRDAVARSISRE